MLWILFTVVVLWILSAEGRATLLGVALVLLGLWLLSQPNAHNTSSPSAEPTSWQDKSNG